MARDVNRELLELAAFEGEELEAFLPRWLETAERCKLTDDKIEYALDVYLPQNWDLKYLGVRKMLGAYLRELADIVHTPEMKESGVKILYGILPAIANYYYAAKYAGGDKIFIGFPDLLMVNTLNSFFHAAAPFLTVAEEYGFTYVGGHPMAGTQYSGYANSKADMFQGAPMVVVPRERDDILLLDRVKKLLTPAGFSHITVTTAEHHDEMIAYTSQMCHVISNAYVKSPRAQMHKGYSAGSYMDLTRVAWLNEHMWTDLFLENRDFLLRELDEMIGHLQEYKTALEQGNGDRLCTLLAEGRICKEKVDAE